MEAAPQISYPKVAEAPKFDLDTYISNYRGRTRFHRLYHMGTISTYLAPEALKLAVTEAKKGLDVLLYEKAVKALAEVAPGDPQAVLDQQWIQRTEAGVKKEAARLEQELKGYKNNLIKESIRMGYDDLGKHYYETGNQTEASKVFLKERDFCQLPVHVSVMNLRLIAVYIDQSAWHNVEVNASRLRHSQSKPDADKTEPKLNAVIGMAAMANRRYADAAEHFLSIDPKMLNAKLDDPADDDAYNEVLTPNDVATYGALCALASLDREGLQSRVLDNPKFRPYLELEPHLRRAISAFISGRYSTTLSILDSYKVDYLMDLHLYAHLAQLYLAVRSKALTEYFNPFSTITFTALGAAFGASEHEVIAMAADLIRSGQLDARLDLDQGLLVSNVVDKRRQVQEKALSMSEEYERTALQRLLRMEAIMAGLEVKPPLRDGPVQMELDSAMQTAAAFGGKGGRMWRR